MTQSTRRFKHSNKNKASMSAIKFPAATGGYIASPSGLPRRLPCNLLFANTKDEQRTPCQSKPPSRNRITNPNALRNPDSFVMSSPGERKISNGSAQSLLKRAVRVKASVPLHNSTKSKLRGNPWNCASCRMDSMLYLPKTTSGTKQHEAKPRRMAGHQDTWTQGRLEVGAHRSLIGTCELQMRLRVPAMSKHAHVDRCTDIIGQNVN